MPGTYGIWRDDESEIHISDPTVSRRHARVTVDDAWSVTITPLTEAQNGVTANDREIDGPTQVSDVDVFGLGGARLSFRPFVRAEGERVARRPAPLRTRKGCLGAYRRWELVTPKRRRRRRCRPSRLPRGARPSGVEVPDLVGADRYGNCRDL